MGRLQVSGAQWRARERLRELEARYEAAAFANPVQHLSLADRLQISHVLAEVSIDCKREGFFAGT